MLTGESPQAWAKKASGQDACLEEHASQMVRHRQTGRVRPAPTITRNVVSPTPSGLRRWTTRKGSRTGSGYRNVEEAKAGL
jgi:hypothetical protein